LYLHGFIVGDDGQWVVVQQGMNGESRTARRYHWLSDSLKSFVEQRHPAIGGQAQGEIINLTDRRAAPSRGKQLELLASHGPDRITRELVALADARNPPAQARLPFLTMPAHHDVRAEDIQMRRLPGNLFAAAERGP